MVTKSVPAKATRTRVGVLKPDHLGDLVLSAPAIEALRRRYAELTLYCHPGNLGLAAHLFPGIDLRPLLMPHLDKDLTTDLRTWKPPSDIWDDLDYLVCLRWDGYIQQVVDGLSCAYRTTELSFEKHHVAVEQYAVAAPLAGRYDLLTSYRHPAATASRRPKSFGSIGLSLSAGYRLNAWPHGHWIDLGSRLVRAGATVSLIGGPAEATRLEIVAGGIRERTGYECGRIVGDGDYGGFLKRLDDAVDWVVATDSGTAHLAALVRPVVSLFGRTDWRRWAPLGKHNVVLSRRLACSPCRAFDRVLINTCHSQECMVNLTPDQVWNCLRAYLDGIDLAEDVCHDGVWMSAEPWFKPID